MRTILALLFILTAAAGEVTLTPEQKLAALVFTDVRSIDVTTLVEVEMPGDEPEDKDVVMTAAVYPLRTIDQNRGKELLAMIAAAGNYRFDDTAKCFDPGLRIRIHEKQRIITLNVCLECAKMSVSTAPGKSFIIDFSQAGEIAYKATYVDFVVLKEGLERK